MAWFCGALKGGQNEQLAVVQAQRRDVDEAAPDRTPPRQQVGLAGLERAQKRVNPHHPVPMVGDEGVAFDPLVEGNSLRLQPMEPRFAHEFAVGQQDGDPLRAKDREEALHQSLSLGRVGVARLVEDAPEDRHGDAAIGNTEHQKIEVYPAKLPVGAIHRQPPRAIPDRDQTHQQSRPVVKVDLERAKESYSQIWCMTGWIRRRSSAVLPQAPRANRRPRCRPEIGHPVSRPITA